MKYTFEPGDVVRLASGGPRMTVEYVTCGRTAKCVWWPSQQDSLQAFDSHAGDVKELFFPVASLRPVQEDFR